MNKKLEILKMTDEALDKRVKIQGTPYDRKRTVSESILKKMKSLAKNKSVAEIARQLGMNYHTVRYNIDPEYRQRHNASRSGAHTGKDHITVKNRVAYKRELVAAGKVTA